MLPAARPPALKRAYARCDASLLAARITVVVTAKDTCSQTPALFAHLATLLPREMRVIYAHPTFPGCERALPPAHLFPSLIVLELAARDPPLRGFLEAHAIVETPYALLMHNDAYPMDEQCVCELYRALVARPDAPFAVPQLFERSSSGVVVPHAHHKNLHISRGVVSYDVDWDMLTRRAATDFREHSQPDFMEDHAYLGRVEGPLRYTEFLDARASFTLEYVDAALAMRERGVAPWYVPSARVLFDVDPRRVAWFDVPYFAFKRSDRVAHEVRRYLERKWGVRFPNTGIWTYVRSAYLCDAAFSLGSLPTQTADQALLYYAWFASVGFDLFDNRTFDAFARTAPVGDRVPVDRTARHDEPPPAPAHTPASRFLPTSRRGPGWFDARVEAEWMHIAVRTSDDCRPDACGLLIVRQRGACECWVYEAPCSATSRLDDALDAARLPARITHFREVRRAHATARKGEAGCAPDAPCHLDLEAFRPGDVVLQWKWRPIRLG